MKKIIIAIFALFVFTASSFAAISNNELAATSSKSQVSRIIILGDVTGLSDESISQRIQETLDQNNDDELTCSLTVKGTIDIGVFEFEITVTISGPCSEVKRDGKRIANEILNEVKGALEKAF